MKSNFSPLKTTFPQLFEPIHAAENLFVNGHYHFVPTAIRLYAEGILLFCLGYSSNTYNTPSFVELIKEFKQKKRQPHIYKALEDIRVRGNRASHFEAEKWQNDELISLFKHAVTLQNYLIIEFSQIRSNESVFDENDFPEPVVRIDRQVHLEKINRLASQNKELQHQLQTLNQEFEQLNNEKLKVNKKLEVFSQQFKETEQKLAETEKQKTALQTHLQQTQSEAIQKKEALEKKLLELQKSQTEKDQEQQIRLQNRLEETENHITSLEKKLGHKTEEITQLTQEKQLYHAQIKELETQQASILTQQNQKTSDLQQFFEEQTDLIQIQDQDELTQKQQALIQINQGHVYVSAPPGAGKTRILTTRLQHAITQYDFIVSLTFTNKAAEEMLARAQQVIPESELKNKTYIGNFHTFCLEQIKSSRTLSYKIRKSAILSDEYQKILFEDALVQVKQTLEPVHELSLPALPEAWLSLKTQIHEDTNFRYFPTHPDNGKESLHRVFNEIYCHILIWELIENPEKKADYLARLAKKLPRFLSKVHFWLKGLKQKPYTDQKESPIDQALHIGWLIYNQFREEKAIAESIDFDDILCLGLNEIIQSEKKLPYIQVDEVQDLNPLQWDIIKALTNENSHVFAVGDPEQSIYGFLGASLENLQHHVSQFDETHSLEENFRSDRHIVNILNQYRNIHWGLPPVIPRREGTDNATLLLRFENETDEQDYLAQRIQTTLNHTVTEPDNDRNFGILLSTNKACESYCETFQKHDIPFFRVSQYELMQTDIVQDWLSYLKIRSGKSQRIDWYRLLHRFALKTSDVPYIKTGHAEVRNLVDTLFNNGLEPFDIYSPHNQIFDYQIKQLVNDFKHKDIVIFDTETTGLDFEDSKIIQLAAIKVNIHGVQDEFDKYIKIDLSSEQQAKAFAESQKIHKIDKTCIENGDDLKEIFEQFHAFCSDNGQHPDKMILAHNLSFDKTMLGMNVLNQLDSYQFQKKYFDFLKHPQMDSLSISRNLFPHLPSHKLADLLNTFSLEGINSHNAIDDVKATGSLVKYLVTHLEKKIEFIDSLLNQNLQYQTIIQGFNTHWSNLTELVNTHIEGQSMGKSQLSDILEEWIDYVIDEELYVKQQSFPTSVLKGTITDIQSKLMPWLDKNGFKGLLNDIIVDTANNDTNKQMLRLFTIKESDLIDPKIHKVIISTVHRSKGLEFDTVVIPQVVDGAYPGWVPKELPDEEKNARHLESKRLLYVALSRGQNKLIVSYHENYLKYPKELSPFLRECQDQFQFVKKIHRPSTPAK